MEINIQKLDVKLFKMNIGKYVFIVFDNILLGFNNLVNKEKLKFYLNLYKNISCIDDNYHNDILGKIDLVNTYKIEKSIYLILRNPFDDVIHPNLKISNIFRYIHEVKENDNKIYFNFQLFDNKYILNGNFEICEITKTSNVNNIHYLTENYLEIIGQTLTSHIYNRKSTNIVLTTTYNLTKEFEKLYIEKFI